MNSKIKKPLIIIAIILGVSFGIYESAIFAPVITEGESMRLLATYEAQVEVQDIVVLATVESVETKLVDESTSGRAGTYDEELEKYVPYGEEIFEEEHVPYQFITLKIDEYIKDETDNFADTLTIRDKANGVGSWKNMKVNYHSDEVVDYNVGEQSIFVVGKNTDEDYLYVTGYIAKYDILDNDTIQSKDMAEMFESFEISEQTTRQPMVNVMTMTNSFSTGDSDMDFRMTYSLPIPLDQALSTGKQIVQQQQAESQE
jgi:hypothetical protein